jgi:subtilisin-like proprotein convertase family protein
MNIQLPSLRELAIALLLSFPIQTQALSITAGSSPGLVIADDNLLGVADTINLTTAITSISDVRVTLAISGGYSGDYYAYLRHSDSRGVGFSILLNRVGVTASNPYGSADRGLNVTFSDSALADVHSASASGGVVSGSFQPDARNVSPFSVLDTSPRSAFLSSFDGMDANGSWTLFIADLAPVGIGTLETWGLTVDGQTQGAVPDGGSSLALLGLALLGLGSLRRWLAKA